MEKLVYHENPGKTFGKPWEDGDEKRGTDETINYTTYYDDDTYSLYSFSNKSPRKWDWGIVMYDLLFFLGGVK